MSREFGLKVELEVTKTIASRKGTRGGTASSVRFIRIVSVSRRNTCAIHSFRDVCCRKLWGTKTKKLPRYLTMGGREEEFKSISFLATTMEAYWAQVDPPIAVPRACAKIDEHITKVSLNMRSQKTKCKTWWNENF